MAGFVYILASKPYGTLYVGVTNDLSRRVWEHREGSGSRFCAKYGVRRLCYYEELEDISFAIHREKRLKKYPRQWKINLIEGMNPRWEDLYETWNC